MAVEPFDYAEAVQDAIELLQEFGRDDLVIRSFTETGDAWNPSRAQVDTIVTGVIIDYSDRAIDGTRILATDKRALISPNANIVPTKDMRLVEDGEEYEIVNLSILKPAGTVLLYDLQVRK